MDEADSRPARRPAIDAICALALNPFRGSVQEQYSVTQHRAQLFHPAKQLGALGARTVPQTLDHGRQVYPDSLDRIFQRAAFVNRGALGFARAANFCKVNYLRHHNTV